MAELDLIFAGAGVAPDTLDARKALSVAFAFVDALTAVVSFEWALEEPPFVVTLTSIGGGSVKYSFGHQLITSNRLAQVEAERAWDAAPLRLTEYARSAKEGPKRLRPKLITLLDKTLDLPANVNAAITRGNWAWSLSETAHQPAIPVVKTVTSFRATVLTSGGKKPRVRLARSSDHAAFSLQASTALVQQAGKLLYKEVDITARATRLLDPPSYPIIDGHLIEIRELSEQDPVEAFDKWYAAIGRPLLNDNHG